MSFFDSDIVRAEVAKVQEIQQEIYVSSMRYPLMTTQQKIEHLDKMQELLEKQKILHTRIKLSDDNEAKDMLEKMKKTAESLGIPRDVSMDDLFKQMQAILDSMKSNIQRAA